MPVNSLPDLGHRSVFGEWLIGRLSKLRLSQRALARQLGVSQATIHRWVVGEHPPSTEYLSAMGVLLDVAPQTILDLLATPENMDGPASGVRRRREVVHVPLRRIVPAGEDITVPASQDYVAWTPRQYLTPAERARIFAVEVIGACLTPAIQPGDILFMDPEAPRRHNKIALVRIDGVEQVKCLESRPEGWVCVSNTGPIVPVEEVVVLGIAIQRLSDL